jgi:4-carboxymuconolactone decarboxylase
VALIPYADEDPRDDRVRGVVERLPEPRINLFRMLANAPALIGPTLRLGEAILTKGDLDATLRELAILHTARLTGTEYEWVQHQAIARLVGVAEQKIQAIADGQITDAVFERRELLTLRLVAHLLEDPVAPAELVTETEAAIGRSPLFELMILTGYYAMLGGVMRAVRLDVDDVLEKGILDRAQLAGTDSRG